MREILFRGKTKDTNWWIEGYYAIESNHACFRGELKHTHFIFKDEFMDWGIGGLVQYEVIPETVGQYTGLTDKNGKKIFEGDIVKVQDDVYGSPFCDGITGQVVYDETAFFIKPHNHMESQWLFNECAVYEIIGNIHDNPELLKGGESNVKTNLYSF